jgi:hypothetical protein
MPRTILQVFGWLYDEIAAGCFQRYTFLKAASLTGVWSISSMCGVDHTVARANPPCCP